MMLSAGLSGRGRECDRRHAGGKMTRDSQRPTIKMQWCSRKTTMAVSFLPRINLPNSPILHITEQCIELGSQISPMVFTIFTLLTRWLAFWKGKLNLTGQSKYAEGMGRGGQRTVFQSFSLVRWGRARCRREVGNSESFGHWNCWKKP